MPPLTRWFVKAGFLALMAALVLELLLVRPPDRWPALPNLALHLGAIHLLTVGWLLQMIAGVAFWMFPKHPTHPPRGDERIGWAAFALVNLGLLLRLVGEPWRIGFGGPDWPLAMSGLMQLGGVGCIIWILWPRVREFRA